MAPPHGPGGVRPESLTNQLRSLAKHKPRRDTQRLLVPLPATTAAVTVGRANSDVLMDTASLQKLAQSPLRLQWLVDDFVKAAGSGDLKKVDQYIRGGVPVDRNHSVLHYSALHAAAALENDEVAKVLVQAGADVNARTQKRESALHMAARYGKPAVAQEMLRHSAEMKSPNHLGFTPMEIAADRQDRKLEQLLEPPPDAPTQLHAQAISSTSLTVAWSARWSAASAYSFRVTWTLCDSAGECVEECAAPLFRICNLLPASKYNIVVQAGNHTIGWSERSPSVTFCTDGDAPNAMVAPLIIAVGDTCIRMRLQLPQSNGADITRVSIQSQCTGSIASVSTSSFRRLLKPQDHESAWESIVSDVSQLRSCDAADASAAADSGVLPSAMVVGTSNGLLEGYKEFVATGLAPGHVYYFRVCAWNERGWSPDGEVSDGICTNDCPKVVRRAARSMQLVWTKPYSTEHIDCYELQARVSTSTKWEVLATRVSGQSFAVRDLVPATAYSFRVVPHYALSGWGDAHTAPTSPLESTDAAPPEPPERVRVLDRTAHAVSVTWQIPRCNGHVVESYALQYRLCSAPTPGGAAPPADCGTGDWVDAGSAIPVDFGERFVVDRLRRGSAYQFRVLARNALGDGAFSSCEQVTWTYPFLAPTAPVCTARSSFSLTIAWRDGHHAGATDADREDALEFDVLISQVESLAAGGVDDESASTPAAARHWVVAAENLRAREALVSGLAPLGCYVFRIHAHRGRSAGSTAPAAGAALTPASGDPELQATSVLSPESARFQTLRRM